MKLLRQVKLLFLRVGSPGSVGRWAARNAARVKRRYPHLTEAEVARGLWRMRYTTVPPRRDSREERRLRAVTEQSIYDLHSLCSAVAFVEMDLAEGDGELYDVAMEAMHLELERGRRSTTRRKEWRDG